MDFAGADLHDYSAGALTVLDYQVENEPLFVHADSSPHDLFVENVQQGLAGEVCNEECAGLTLTSESAGAKPALFVAAEGDTVVFHLDNFGTSLTAHDLDGVLVSEIVGSLDSVVCVVVPVVSGVFKRGVDAALSRVGVAPNGMDLGDDRYVGPVLGRGQRRSHAGQSSAYDQDIVGVHSGPPLRSQIPQMNIAHRTYGVHIDCQHLSGLKGKHYTLTLTLSLRERGIGMGS